MWTPIGVGDVSIEVHAQIDGELIGGICARDVAHQTGLRLFVVSQVWVSIGYRRRGLGAALYLAAAALIPGILIPSAQPSRLAGFTWASLAKRGCAVFVESPCAEDEGQGDERPSWICGLSVRGGWTAYVATSLQLPPSDPFPLDADPPPA